MQPARPLAQPQSRHFGGGEELDTRNLKGGNIARLGEKLLNINKKATWWHGHGHDDETRLMMCLSIRARLTDWAITLHHLHPQSERMMCGEGFVRVLCGCLKQWAQRQRE